MLKRNLLLGALLLLTLLACRIGPAPATEIPEDFEPQAAEEATATPRPTATSEPTATPTLSTVLDGESSPLSPLPTPEAGARPGEDGEDGDSALDNLIAAAKAEMVQVADEGLTTDEIVVVATTEQEWPDAGLGCPEPGFAYATVITPGYEIILSDGESEYIFHADQQDTVRLCYIDGERVGE